MSASIAACGSRLCGYPPAADGEFEPCGTAHSEIGLARVSSSSTISVGAVDGTFTGDVRRRTSKDGVAGSLTYGPANDAAYDHRSYAHNAANAGRQCGCKTTTSRYTDPRADHRTHRLEAGTRHSFDWLFTGCQIVDR